MITTRVVVFLFLFMASAQSGFAQSFTKVSSAIEYLHSNGPETNQPNYLDATHQFGHLAVSGNYLGYHHNGLFAFSATVPMEWKGVVFAPGVTAILGTHETGPGFVVRWEASKWGFRTQGTAGFYHPVDHKGLHFLGDPIEFEKKLKSVWAGYSGEFGRYGYLMKKSDRIHSAQLRVPVSNHFEAIVAYVPTNTIVRVGFRFTTGTNK